MEIFDLIILGGGVSGLSAGLYAARGKVSTILLEKNAPGGQVLLTDNIENYPGIEHIEGFQLGTQMMNHAQKFGLKIQYEGVEEINLFDDHVEVKTAKNTYNTKYLIAATGSNPRTLNLPSEDKYRGKGVSYCATCDGAFFKDKEVIVVGGGNSAFDEGIALTKFAKKVTIVHRSEVFKAEKYLQDLAHKNPKMDFILDTEIKEIKGDDKVKSVILHNNKTNEDKEMPIDGVFVFIGYVPNSQLFKDKLQMTPGNEIIVDLDMKTSHGRVYASGDLRAGAVKQVIASSGDGVTAAINVMRKLREG